MTRSGYVCAISERDQLPPRTAAAARGYAASRPKALAETGWRRFATECQPHIIRTASATLLQTSAPLNGKGDMSTTIMS
jgi:hypothetical protein